MDRFNVLSEIPPISSEDSFVLFERHKMDFSFPVHIHNECELNYVSGAAGAMRVVGDNIEEIGDRDLVLITGSKLEHAWFNGHKAPDAEITEITIQFSPDLFSSGLINKAQFFSIKKLFEAAKKGVSFSPKAIDEAETLISRMGGSRGFKSILLFLELLNTIASDPEYRILSQYSSSADMSSQYDSRRVTRIMKYLNANYNRDITLEEIASVVNMSIPTFSRFIRQRTGKSFVNCLNDIRISVVSKRLIEEPTRTVSEIAFESGFSNLSNFNRVFKKKKGMTPQEYRSIFFKRYMIV